MPTTIAIANALYDPFSSPYPITELDVGQTAAVPFRFTRSGDFPAQVVFWSVAPAPGFASADASDFVINSGAISFAAGQTVGTADVVIRGDDAYEDYEGFVVTAEGVSSARTDIRNDDERYSITPANVVKAEGGTVTIFTFLVDAERDGSQSTSVNWSVVGSGANPATAEDFVGGVLPSGNVGFRSSQPGRGIEIAVQGDTAFEADEGFTVTLQPISSGISFTSQSATGVIINDDAAPVVQPPPPVVVVGPVVTTPPTPVPPPITYDLGSTTAQVVRLYDTTLDRIPEPAGVVFYRSLLDSGRDTLHTLVDNFTGSPEFVAKYGNTTNEQLVELLYRNVLGREGSVADVDWYEARMAEGSMDRGDVVVGFSESPEHRGLTAADVATVYGYGIA